MNIAMLYVLLITLMDEIKETHQKLEAVMTSLQNMSSNPADAGLQEAFGTNLEDLYAFLQKAPSNAVSGLRLHLMAQIGLSEYLGANLMGQIEHSVQKNGIVIGGIVKDVTNLHAVVGGRLNAAQQFIHGCDAFGIEGEELDAGDSVFTFVIPEEFLCGDMVKLATEVKGMEQVVGNVSELVLDERKSGYKIRTIGTGSVIMEILLPSVVLAAGVLKVLHLALQCYKEMLEVKKVRQDISELSVLPSKVKVLDVIDKDLKASINKGIDAAVKEFLATEKPTSKSKRSRTRDSGRGNELKNELRIMFKSLLIRLEHGFKFDMEVGEDEASDEESDKSASPDVAKLAQIRENIPLLRQEVKAIGDQKIGTPLLSMEAESEDDKSE